MKYKKLTQKIDQAYISLLQGKEGEGNEFLTEVFDELLNVSSTFSPEVLEILAKLMEIMYEAQKRRDHVYLVDILKYELPKHINHQS